MYGLGVACMLYHFQGLIVVLNCNVSSMDVCVEFLKAKTE